MSIEEIWHHAGVKFDPKCINAVRGAADALAYSNVDITSGAGHDVCQIRHIVPTAGLEVP